MTVNKHIRGIRDSIPPGYVLGRTGGGAGPAMLIPITNFTSPGYVANTTIQVGGPAGGDLSGTYPNPAVAKIQGHAVKNSAPTDGQILKWVNANTDWEPTTPTANPTATIGSSAVNGTAQTFMRSDGAPALPATLPALSGANLTNLNASNLGSGTVPAARLPNPSATTLGGIESIAAVTHNFLTSISTSGVPAQAQPATTDLSDYIAGGSWTPTDASPAGLVFTNVNCQYTTIGNMVFAYGRITYPTTASGSSASITGLPFTVASPTYGQIPGELTNSSSGTIGFQALCVRGTILMNVLLESTNAAASNAQLSGNTINFGVWYPLT